MPKAIGAEGQRAGNPETRDSHLYVLLVRVFVIFYCGNRLLHLAKNHVQMLIVCLLSTAILITFWPRAEINSGIHIAQTFGDMAIAPQYAQPQASRSMAPMVPASEPAARSIGYELTLCSKRAGIKLSGKGMVLT